MIPATIRAAAMMWRVSRVWIPVPTRRTASRSQRHTLTRLGKCGNVLIQFHKDWSPFVSSGAANFFEYRLCGYSPRQGRLGLAIELPIKCSCIETLDFITSDVEFPEDVHRLD